MAERMKATVRSFAVDHTPLLTAPQKVVDIIVDAAKTTLLKWKTRSCEYRRRRPQIDREHRVPEAADSMAFAAWKKFGRAEARPRGQISLALIEPGCRLEGREQKLTGERPGIER